LTKIVTAAKDAMTHCTNNSNTFKLDHLKKVYVKKKNNKAANDGLDPDTVNTTISNRTTKIALITAAIESDTLPKTEQRFIVKYSVQGAYTYALTVLSTHYCEGDPTPHIARFISQEELPYNVYWVKQAFDSEQAYPVDPNFVFSTDDTTLFVFEGSTGDGEECKWNLIDKTND